jgi:catechol 2,3-dioxygenase-like lactoylglutathione lyase family enzyme
VTPLWLDHLVLVTPNLEVAAEPFERLGLTLTPRMEHAGAGTANRVFFLGGPAGHFYVELLTVHDREAASASGASAYLPVHDAGGGVARLMLATDELDGVVARLEEAGIPSLRREVSREDGSKIADVAIPAAEDQAGCSIGIMQYLLPEAERYEARRGRGLFDHAVSVKRLDHLAMIPAEPSSTEAFWTGPLEVPVAGEVTTPAMTIRQLKAGDAVLELLVPSGPESPVAARPKGLIPMIAVEVPDVDLAVTAARERGFEPTDPAAGVLPGTRTATIPGDAFAGLAIQLLEYA